MTESFISAIHKHYKVYNKSLLMTNFQIPTIQRDEIQNHIDEIYQFEQQYYDSHAEYCLHGNISVAIDIHTKTEYLIDGQHRLIAYKLLQEKYPHRSINISIDYYECQNNASIELIYKLINTNQINPITQLSLDEYKIINQTIRWLQTEFQSFAKKTANPHKPSFNPETIKNALIQKQIVQKLEIKNSQQLIDLITDLNTFYSQVPVNMFKKWGVRDISKYMEKINAMSNRFYLGLYKTEWIDILIDCPSNQYDLIDHMVEGYRIPISKLLRKQVWNSHLLDGLCYCCNYPITYDNFECGHINAVSKGGKTTVDNLKPVCRSCNSDMRNTNMLEYKNTLSAQLLSQSN